MVDVRDGRAVCMARTINSCVKWGFKSPDGDRHTCRDERDVAAITKTNRNVLVYLEDQRRNKGEDSTILILRNA